MIAQGHEAGANVPLQHNAAAHSNGPLSHDSPAKPVPDGQTSLHVEDAHKQPPSSQQADISFENHQSNAADAVLAEQGSTEHTPSGEERGSRTSSRKRMKAREEARAREDAKLAPVQTTPVSSSSGAQPVSSLAPGTPQQGNQQNSSESGWGETIFQTELQPGDKYSSVYLLDAGAVSLQICTAQHLYCR